MFARSVRCSFTFTAKLQLPGNTTHCYASPSKESSSISHPINASLFQEISKPPADILTTPIDLVWLEHHSILKDHTTTGCDAVKRCVLLNIQIFQLIVTSDGGSYHGSAKWSSTTQQSGIRAMVAR